MVPLPPVLGPLMVSSAAEVVTLKLALTPAMVTVASIVVA